MRVPIPWSCQESMSKFLGFANMIGEKLYLIVVLISISLIMKEVEYFFMSMSNMLVFFYEQFISLVKCS